MLKKYKGEMLLLASAVIAGITLVYQRIEGEKEEGALPPIAFSALRQCVSLMTTALLSSLIKNLNIEVETGQSALLNSQNSAWERRKEMLFFATIVACASTGGSICQQVGMTDGSDKAHIGKADGAGKAGFLTSFSVVLTPLLDCVIYANPKKASVIDWIAALSAIFGVLLLTNCSIGSLGLTEADLILLLGAFFWAVNLCVGDLAAKILNPVDLTVADFNLCACFSVLIALSSRENRAALLNLGLLRVNLSLVVGTGVAQAVAVVLNRVGFMSVSSSRACLIMSLESVIAAAAGNLMLGEALTLRELTGALVMLGSTALSIAGKGEDAREQEQQAARLLAKGRTQPREEMGYGAILQSD